MTQLKKIQKFQLFIIIFFTISFIFFCFFPMIYYSTFIKVNRLELMMNLALSYIFILNTMIPIVCTFCANYFEFFMENLIFHLKMPKPDLNLIAILQIKIFEGVINFNKCASIQMSLLLASNLMGATFSLFEIYDVMFNDFYETERIFFLIVMNLGGIHYISLSFMMIVVTSVAKNRGIKLRDISYGKSYGNLSKKEMKRNSLILLQMKHMEIKFSCGMFEINWKLITSVSFITLLLTLCKFQPGFLISFFSFCLQCYQI